MEVCTKRQDGASKAIRSLVHWKDKPDHVFTGCDDGTVKVGASLYSRYIYIALTLLELDFNLYTKLSMQNSD